jgi:hypothetical protein
VRHAAARIGLGDGGESIARRLPGERMIERHRSVEGLLGRTVALNFELDLAEARQLRRLLLAHGSGGHEQCRRNDDC